MSERRGRTRLLTAIAAFLVLAFYLHPAQGHGPKLLIDLLGRAKRAFLGKAANALLNSRVNRRFFQHWRFQNTPLPTERGDSQRKRTTFTHTLHKASADFPASREIQRPAKIHESTYLIGG